MTVLIDDIKKVVPDRVRYALISPVILLFTRCEGIRHAGTGEFVLYGAYEDTPEYQQGLLAGLLSVGVPVVSMPVVVAAHVFIDGIMGLVALCLASGYTLVCMTVMNEISVTTVDNVAVAQRDTPRDDGEIA